MAAGPVKAVEATNSGGAPMGANSTQAIGISLFLTGFVFLAGAAAGGGVLLALVGLALIGGACVFFLKCKPWEDQKE